MLRLLFPYFFKHSCNFDKPIVSQYRTFHTRRIIYECNCGKRKSFEISTEFGKAFPIPTALLLSNLEFNAILAGGDVPKLITEEPKIKFGKTD